MKKAILALCVIGLTVACNKSDKDKNSDSPAAPAPKAEGEVTTVTKETPAASPRIRIAISKRNADVKLGQGVANGKSLLEKCLKGDESYEALDQAQISYRLRKVDAGSKDANLIAEMVIVTGASSLNNSDINSNAKSADEKEFNNKCGTASVAKIYSGVRVSKSYKLSKEALEKVQELQMSGSEASKSSLFTDAVEKALEGSNASVPKNSIEGLDSSSRTEREALKDLDLDKAMDEVRKMTAGQKSKGEEQIKGKAMEADIVDYSADIKAKAISPKAEQAPKSDDSSKSEDKSSDDKKDDSDKEPEIVDQSQEEFVF